MGRGQRPEGYLFEELEPENGPSSEAGQVKDGKKIQDLSEQNDEAIAENTTM